MQLLTGRSDLHAHNLCETQEKTCYRAFSKNLKSVRMWQDYCQLSFACTTDFTIQITHCSECEPIIKYIPSTELCDGRKMRTFSHHTHT